MLVAQCLLAIVPALTATGTTQAGPGKAESLTSLLQSGDPEKRSKGYEEAETRATLSPEEIRALVRSLQYRDDPALEKFTPYGPSTGATRVTRILVSHFRETLPFLVEGLRDSDWNVRRHVAFAMGASCDRQVVPHLENAMKEELARAEHSFVKPPNGRQSHLLSVLVALAQAHARLDPVGAFDECLGLFGAGRRNFRNLAANVMLGEIVRHPPGNRMDGKNEEWSNCRATWAGWWRENRGKPVGELFSVEICR
jgi:hypothetical protein